jgi:hypothetical protein
MGRTTQHPTNQTHQITNMKTTMISKILLTLSLVFVLGSAVAPVHGGTEPSSASVIGPPNQFPVVTIHSVSTSSGDTLTRGQIGAFVLSATPQILFATTFVNFKVSGTAIPGVDFVRLCRPPSSDNPASEQSWSRRCPIPEQESSPRRTALW